MRYLGSGEPWHVVLPPMTVAARRGVLEAIDSLLSLEPSTRGDL